MLDVAREQNFSYDHLREFAQLSLNAGYESLGLYLEHRLAYPSLPWMHGTGSLQPAVVKKLQAEFPSLRIVPFINLLGHFEGFLYTEEGKQYREARFQGMQACPSNPDFVTLCRNVIDDTLDAFASDLVHIGGDETWQLGQCDSCKAKVEASQGDGRAELYGQHFGKLAHYVLERGRRPAVWGDMLLSHPEAATYLPKETLVFDWQYFGGVRESATKFVDLGFEVVGCPAIQTYNATWMNLEASEHNVREVCTDVGELGLHGTCVTTWECGLMANYETLKPSLQACGEILNGTDTPFMVSYLRESERYEEWARLMGIELATLGGTFTPGKIRSSLKVRLLLNANPFLAWLHHRGEFDDGRALDLFERALAVAPNPACRVSSALGKGAVEFIRFAEQARQEYSQRNPGRAATALAPARQVFDELEKFAKVNHEMYGGSLADVHRCRAAKEHVERVMNRIKQYGDGSLGYLPAFEHLTHHKFIPHDQAAWWLINRWANE